MTDDFECGICGMQSTWSLHMLVGRDVNGTDISRPYLNLIRSESFSIRLYPISSI